MLRNQVPWSSGIPRCNANQRPAPAPRRQVAKTDMPVRWYEVRTTDGAPGTPRWHHAQQRRREAAGASRQTPRRVPRPTSDVMSQFYGIGAAEMASDDVVLRSVPYGGETTRNRDGGETVRSRCGETARARCGSDTARVRCGGETARTRFGSETARTRSGSETARGTEPTKRPIRCAGPTGARELPDPGHRVSRRPKPSTARAASTPQQPSATASTREAHGRARTRTAAERDEDLPEEAYEPRQESPDATGAAAAQRARRASAATQRAHSVPKLDLSAARRFRT